MIEFNNCKIFAETIEEEALNTIKSLCNDPVFKDSKIRIMPDCHQGKGIVIGFTCPAGNYVNPNHIGVDIGCQMSTIELSSPLNEDKYVEFEHKIRKNIPTGYDIHSKPIIDEKELFKYLNKEYQKACSFWPEMIDDVGRIDDRFISSMCRRIGMNEGIFYKSLGSIGGGNHFAEYGLSDDGRAFFTVHCGSRNFGVKVANYWVKRSNQVDYKKYLDSEIKRIKTTVSDRSLWQNLIEEAKIQAKNLNPLGYLSGENLKGYLSDMVIAQAYAHYNHKTILDVINKILSKYKIKEVDRINTIHNYISFEDHIIRKGAIQSYKGCKMIIPFNMRDGLAICEGKSNEDWNFSSPHGAGRIMSRIAARNKINLDEFKETMKGIYSTCIDVGTLDESPMAYKNTEEIIRLIEPTAEILFFVKPKINIKASDTLSD